MANSSFFKNTGTSTQIQGSANASAAAALASEQAALVSKNAAATSETNSAASAAAALVSKNAAATSAASANSDASAASISATASQTAATSSSANAALTSADATQTAADRVQTGLDRVATNSDAVQTAADRVQTGLDVTSSSNSAAAALSSRNAAATSETNAAASASSSAADAASTAADVISTAADAASTAADVIATAADRVQTGLDVTATATSATNAATSASAAASDATAAAASAASAANSYDLFDDRYLGSKTGYATAQTGPALDNDGNALVAGTLFFSADANEMRVYDGAGWIAASSAGSASLINYHYTATAAQTTFSGADDNSNTLSYTVDNLIVTKNGIVLEVGTDYTATNGTSIVLAVAAAAGDEINVVAFKSFTTADMVSATTGGTFQGNVDFSAGADVTGNITVTGTVDGRDVAADGTKLDGIEALADVTDTANVTAAGAAMLTGATFTGAVTATSFSGNGSALTGIPTPTLTSLGIANHDDITVDASGNVGIGTASPTASLTVGAANNEGTLRIGDNGTYYGEIKRINASDELRIGHYGASQNLTFYTVNTERLRIDASGNAFMKTANSYIAGTTSLGFYGDAASSNGMFITSGGNVGIGHTTPQFGLTMAQGNGDAARIGWEDGSQNKRASIICASSSDALQFHTGTSDAERMRITSGGNVCLGTTSLNGLGGLSYSNADEYLFFNRTTSSGTYIYFRQNGTQTGYISHNATTTSYSTTSDYRLKTAVAYDWDATSRLKQLKPARFAWIADGDDAVPVDGFLAHEVQDIVPEAISGTKDAVDEDGNPDYQGIDQSKLVPLLVKTIQELEARISALEAN